jgi:prevent-host-death family protein
MAKTQKSVGLFEAKTHLSKLVDRVQRGESITITRRGAAVARLVPVSDEKPRNPAEAVARLLKMREGIKLGNTTIRALIEEGRT